MVNAWSLAYEVLYGDLDKEYPIMNTDQKDDTGNTFVGILQRREQLKKMLEEDRMAADKNAEFNVSGEWDKDHLSVYGNNGLSNDPYPSAMSEESPWVYESPDGGKTVTRRKPGDDYTKKEVIQGDYYEGDKKKPAPNLKGPSHQKYQEDKGLEDLKSYVSSTYKGHYTNENSDVQTLDLIHSVGDAESFCRSNALKYLSRYDKKGSAKNDILKAMHYCLLLYYFSGNTQEPDYTNTRYETF